LFQYFLKFHQTNKLVIHAFLSRNENWQKQISKLQY
jgi:hypothetical protein